MQTVPLLIVDAFTEVPFRGNRAGVVLEAGGLQSDQMQKVAAEVGASETAFVCSGEGPGPYRVRFFTPSHEVPLCGHATIAAFHALVWKGRIPVMDGELVVHSETGAGPLPVRLRIAGDLLEGVMMGQLPPLTDPYRGDLGDLSEPLGVSQALIEEGDRGLGPPVRVSTGLRCLHVALPGIEAVRTAAPDFRLLAGLSRRLDVTTVQIAALETESPEAFVHVRTFAPAVGVDEDPVTGTAAGSLGGYLAYINLLPDGQDKRRFRVEQGSEVGRPGFVDVELQMVGQSVTETWVGGRAVIAMEGEMRVP